MPLDWKTADRWLMGEAMTNSQVAEFINYLCDEIGPRWAGSEGERRAVRYIVEKREEHGLEGPRSEDFAFRTWECSSATLALQGQGQYSLDIRPSLFCPPLNVTAPLIDVGYGTDHEVEPLRGRLKGAVALMAMGYEPFTPPRLLTLRLEDLAKLGVACVVSPNPMAGRIMNHGSAHDWRDGAPDSVPLPWVQTSREHGARLARQAAQGRRVTVRVESRIFDSTSQNTLAEIPGTTWPGEHIVLGSHHDTTPDSPGSNDNGSGTSVNLETARLIAALARETGIRPGRTLRFVTFGAEEQTLQGSYAMVRRHYGFPSGSGVPASLQGQSAASEEWPAPRLMINLDELATGNMKGVALVFPELRGLVQRELDGMREGLKAHVMAQMDASGDMFPFALAGIPSSMLWRWRFVGRHPDAAYGHASTDTPDKVRVRELKEYAGLLARLLLRLSHVPPQDWPENRLDVRAIAKRVQEERGQIIRTM